MKTYKEIYQEMQYFNNSVAYGSECDAWGLFLNDARITEGVKNLFCEEGEEEEEEEFYNYWLLVSKGENEDFDKTGSYIG